VNFGIKLYIDWQLTI